MQCQLLGLRKEPHAEEILRELENLPRGLWETYQRVLDGLESDRKWLNLVLRALRWLVFCKRPLHLTELSRAIAIDPSDERFNNRKLVSGETLLKYCRSLVKFCSKSQVVQLSHLSVRQYLTTEFSVDGLKNLYFMDERLGNGELMETSLKCLSFPHFDELSVGTNLEPHQPDDHMAPTLEELRSMRLVPRLTVPQRPESCATHLLQYAILNWPLHGRMVESTLDKYRESILAFLADTPAADNEDIRCRWAIQFCQLHTFQGHPPDVDSVHCLYFLAWFGFVTSLRIAIDRGRYVNPNASALLGRALLPAAYAGETGAVQVLLEANANTAMADLNGESALHFAAREDHPEVIELLLASSRVAVNLKCRMGFTPLHSAVMAASIECVKLLLEGGADVNSRNNRGDTALYYAVQRDNMEIVKLLLRHNADISIPGDQLNTPMHQAARVGSTEVVQMLLEAGGDVSMQNLFRSRPLHLAMDGNSPEVVQLLQAAEEKLLKSDTDDAKIMRLHQQQAQNVLLIVDKETKETHYTALIVDKSPIGSSKLDQDETAIETIRFPKPICASLNCIVCQGMSILARSLIILCRGGRSDTSNGVSAFQNVGFSVNQGSSNLIFDINLHCF